MRTDLNAIHFGPGEYVNQLKLPEVLKLLETGGECPPNELASKHHDLLQLFKVTPDQVQRESALACLKHFVRLGEPFFPLLKKAGIAEQLVSFHWGDTPEVCEALGKLYVTSGLVKVNEPLMGALPDSQSALDRWDFGGKLPLAIAIEQDHVEFAQLLVWAGASLDNIGPVLQGGPQRKALEYAHEVGSSRIAAYLAGVVMSRQLCGADSGKAPATTTRRRAAL